MSPMITIDSEAMEWSSGMEGLSGGIMVKVLNEDKETGALAGIGKLPAGSFEPKHGHPCSCDVLMLQGKLINTETGQEASKGMFWHIPKGELHGPFQVPKDEDCIIFVVTDGPLSPLIKP